MFECEQAQDEGNGRKDGRQFNWYRGITCDVVSGCTSQGEIERVGRKETNFRLAKRSLSSSHANAMTDRKQNERVTMKPH